MTVQADAEVVDDEVQPPRKLRFPSAFTVLVAVTVAGESR